MYLAAVVPADIAAVPLPTAIACHRLLADTQRPRRCSLRDGGWGCSLGCWAEMRCVRAAEAAGGDDVDPLGHGLAVGGFDVADLGLEPLLNCCHRCDPLRLSRPGRGAVAGQVNTEGSQAHSRSATPTIAAGHACHRAAPPVSGLPAGRGGRSTAPRTGDLALRCVRSPRECDGSAGTGDVGFQLPRPPRDPRPSYASGAG
jgi:hypothetical protein